MWILAGAVAPLPAHVIAGEYFPDMTGVIAILLSLYSDRRPQEVLGFDARAAYDRLGLGGALTAQRSNGLFSMVQRIRKDAETALAA